jgi:hypothetical protein
MTAKTGGGGVWAGVLYYGKYVPIYIMVHVKCTCLSIYCMSCMVQYGYWTKLKWPCVHGFYTKLNLCFCLQRVIHVLLLLAERCIYIYICYSSAQHQQVIHIYMLFLYHYLCLLNLLCHSMQNIVLLAGVAA